MAAKTVTRSKRAAIDLRATPARSYQPGDRVSKRDLFPNVSEFERADMKRAILLMEQDADLADSIAEAESLRRQGKEELAELASKYGLEGSGMRWGPYTVYVNGMRTRRTLDAALLVENGVTIEQLEASYKEGQPYMDMRVTREKEKEKA